MRIVSLLPSVTEILFAIGAGDRVVGVTHECDFPPAARALPAVTSSLIPDFAAPLADRAQLIDRHVRASVHGGSSLYALDADALGALAADVIITQELCAVCAVSYDIVARAAKRMRGDGPTIISLEPASLADVYANITTVGEVAGASAGAARLVAELRAREARLRACPRATPLPRVLLLEWSDPVMSAGHWIPDLIDLAGGEPILAHRGANSERLTWEAIAAADPDAIVFAPCGFNLAQATATAASFAHNPAWRELRAVRAGRAYAMDGNAYVSRPGPRLLDSAEIIATALAGKPEPAAAIAVLSLD
jgi:iron complex transport system substrate-binding protein